LPLLGRLRNAAAAVVEARLALRGRRDAVLARFRPSADHARADQPGAADPAG
jgi:hypothetical protein